MNEKEREKVFQQYLARLQYSKNPEKELKNLKKLVKQLELDLDAEEYINRKPIKNTNDARKWFKDEIKSLLASPWEVDKKSFDGITSRSLVPGVNDIGKMFTYVYDPKYKETLPYYDQVPLILLIKPLDNGWHGLNLHYLPPKQRETLITNLMGFMSNKRINEGTRLKLSYKLLSEVAKYRYFAPCFKRYLFSHVRTKTKLIPFNKWPNALLLPVARFKKASITTVWSDSMKTARGFK